MLLEFELNAEQLWCCLRKIGCVIHPPIRRHKRTVNKEAVSIGQWSYEWMRNSTEFLIQSKQDYIYLFEIGFNTEIHPSSCAFPQLSGQILERAIEGRKGPLSTLQMGYFLLIPRETSHSHNLARNSISCVELKPHQEFFSAQVDYIAGLTLLDPQYSWDRRSMPISFNYEKNAILFLLRRETFGLVF